MKEKNITISSKNDFRRFVVAIAKKLKGNEVFLFSAVLGAGKTYWVKILAKELGVKGRVTSPTFSLFRSYPYQSAKDACRKKITHFDLYRLKKYAELETLGFEEEVRDKNTLICIEWPECIKDRDLFTEIKKIDPTKTIFRVEINFSEDLKQRFIRIC